METIQIMTRGVEENLPCCTKFYMIRLISGSITILTNNDMCQIFDQVPLICFCREIFTWAGWMCLSKVKKYYQIKLKYIANFNISYPQYDVYLSSARQGFKLPSVTMTQMGKIRPLKNKIFKYHCFEGLILPPTPTPASKQDYTKFISSLYDFFNNDVGKSRGFCEKGYIQKLYR